MTTLEVIVRVAAVVLLSVFLVFKRSQRWRQSKSLECPSDWTGHGLEAERLLPRVRGVRSNQAPIVRSAKARRDNATFFLNAARGVVRRLAFFSEHDGGLRERNSE